jgi:hypothetical protein
MFFLTYRNFNHPPGSVARLVRYCPFSQPRAIRPRPPALGILINLMQGGVVTFEDRHKRAALPTRPAFRIVLGAVPFKTTARVTAFLKGALAGSAVDVPKLEMMARAAGLRAEDVNAVAWARLPR